MKRIAPFLVPLVLILSVPAWAQGPLTPPGSPSTTMKSLSQIEPRTPIESLPYNITTPGSYYLTGNLSSAGNGIVVSCDNATIDLMGFTLTGPGSGYGIFAQSGSEGIRGLTVKNGGVAFFNWGVYLQGVSQSTFSDLTVVSNADNGVFLQANNAPGNNNRFNRCTIVNNGASGLCLSSYSTVSTCNGNLIQECLISQNYQSGIWVDGSTSCQCDGNVFEDVIINGNHDNGIMLNGASGSCKGNVIKGCTFEANYQSGIKLTADCVNNRIEGNSVSANNKGLDIYGRNNYVADNMVAGNATNYDFCATNQLNLLLSQLPQTIYWPANVKLAGTLIDTNQIAGGIWVYADDVTIDLNGNSLLPGYGGGEGGIVTYGIYSENRNLTVFNGTVSGWNMGGIYALGLGSRISRVTAVKSVNDGIQVGENGMVTDCVAISNSMTGIRVAAGSRVSGCTAIASQTGIYGNDSIIRDCTVSSNYYGIYAESNCAVSGCLAEYNGRGIELGVGNSIDGNMLRHNEYGIYGLDGRSNLVVRNTARESTMNNYILHPQNSVGDEVYSPVGAGAWDNFSH